MKRKWITAIAVAIGAVTLAGAGWTQTTAPNPMPMKNAMQMRGQMMGKQSPQAKPGQMRGRMMGMMMHKGSEMNMGDPLFGQLHSYGCPGFALKFSQQLDLTQAQIEKLQTLKLEFQKLAIQNQADRKVALLDLKQILKNTSPNFKKAQSTLNRITVLEGKLRAAFLNTIERGRQVLTPDQLQKLKSLPAKPGSMMGGGMMR